MRKFPRILPWLYYLIALLISVFLVKLNWTLWTLSSRHYDRLGADVLPQLNNIKQRLQAGEGDRMQALFPEGYFFSHAIYGYSWVNVGLANESLRQRAIAEVEWTLEKLDSDKGRRPFQFQTQVPNGVFYLGWSNRLLGGLLKLQRPEARSPQNLGRFHVQSALLAQAYDRRFMLAAYPAMTWPCDQTVALSSLALHDELFDSNYRSIIQRWIDHIQQNLDPKTQLIPHKVDADTGAIEIAGRSSSQVYLLPFLLELDPAFATQQYQRFRQQFPVATFGFFPVREYPIGISGKGDVDTGPLIFGFSATSTITSLATAKAFNDRELFDSTLMITETLGLPLQVGDQKFYGLGSLIVIDAFLVWGKTWVPWTKVPQPVVNDRALTIHRGAWLGGSLVGLVLLWSPLIGRYWRKKRSLS
ncbi:MAG: hypothetical protein B0A82_24850 [Alkalinema sp. CACIAM 70d]|nr:MAG: hypothetical protein B0A82_24850 [Alkalinema sp. CACIAM 70d]